jgi:hypothetical protein
VATLDTRVRFRFGGSIDPEDFAAFVVERVCRLDLDGEPRIDGTDVTCEVTGQADLVDAFEMACLIGPAGSLVTEFVREDGEKEAAP